ncbi:MAG: hypothetical protein ABFQ95_07325 [Pseudomonadota bacterium]
MKTVKEMKEELDKFNDDDMCYAYEGEVIGLVINRGHDQGVIFCAEGSGEEEDTHLIES